MQKEITKGQKIWQRLLMGLAILLFASIAVNAVLQMEEVSFPIEVPGGFRAGLGLLLSVQLALLVLSAMRWLEKHPGQRAQRLFALAMFLVMAALSCLYVTSYRAIPPTDSLDDLDVAHTLLSSGVFTEDSPFIGTVGIYGNNYLLILLFMQVFRVLGLLGVTDTIPVFYAINTLAVWAGVVMLWRSVCLCGGIRRANKVLVLCVLNPVYYVLLFWIYSLTLTLPVMMGIVLVGIRLYRAKSIAAEAAWSVLMGVLVFLSVELRATAMFPFIAMVVCGVPLLAKRGLLLRGLRAGAVTLAVCALLMTGTAAVKDHYFGQVKEKNLPVTYWLSLGSGGNGKLGSSVNQENLRYARSIEDPKERSAAMVERMLSNYSERGVLGTVSFWLEKMNTVWPEGTGYARKFVYQGALNDTTYEWTAGMHRQLFELYCQAFRLMTVLGMLYLCLRRVRAGEVDTLTMVLLVTVLGGIAFYMIWEIMAIYPAHFILPMAAVASRGLDTARGDLVRVKGRGAKVMGACGLAAYAALTVAVICGIASVAQGTHTFSYYTISTIKNIRVEEPFYMQSVMTQDFRAEGKFNKIRLKSQTGMRNSDRSAYRAVLTDDVGNVVCEKKLTTAGVNGEGQLTIQTGRCAPGHYVLTLEKLEPEKESIALYTKKNDYLDSYDGTLTIDGETPYANDLTMDVFWQMEESYLPEGGEVVAAAGCAGLSVLTALLYVSTGQRRRKMAQRG